MKNLIHKSITDELRAMADIYDEQADLMEIDELDDSKEYREDAVNLKTAAEKLENNNLELNIDERKVVKYELLDWFDKDWITHFPTDKRRLVVAAARLGFLEEYDPEAVIMSTSGYGMLKRTAIVDGKRYNI